jgi:hypothetical protein
MTKVLDALTTDQQDYLDALVHDVASLDIPGLPSIVNRVASTVNNNGEQINYLLSNGWTLDQIKEWIS